MYSTDNYHINSYYFVITFNQFSSIQPLSHVRLFVTPWTAACQASLSITNSRSLLKLMSIESVMPSKHLILCSPLLTPSIFPSIRVFPVSQFFTKYWSFSFSISSSNEYSALNSFRIDQLDLLTVQGTLKSLLQHHSSKASILRHSAFFIIQLLERNIAVTRWNLLARSCLCFLICCLGDHSFPSKEQASFNFLSAVTICSDFGAQNNKVHHCFHRFPIYLP